MNRIEANVATQLGDLSRPRQSHQDLRNQVEADQERSSEEGRLAGQPVSAEDLRSSVAQLQQVVEAASGRELNFGVHESTEDLFVEVRDRQTDEVIKQIPAEGVLELRARIDELVGMLFDDQA